MNSIISGKIFWKNNRGDKMADFNEENGIHAADITWENYKNLIATEGVEKDKIYFIENLTNQSEVLSDLLFEMNQLKALIQNL